MLRLATLSVGLAVVAFLLRAFTRPMNRTADALDDAAIDTASAAAKN